MATKYFFYSQTYRKDFKFLQYLEKFTHRHYGEDLYIRLLLLKMIKCEETSLYLFYLHFTFLTLHFHNNHILNTSYPRAKICLVEKASSWTTIWRIIFTSCYIHSLTTRANVHGDKKGANISMYTVFIHNCSAKTHS